MVAYKIENNTWEKVAAEDTSVNGQYVFLMNKDEIEQFNHVISLNKSLIIECLQRNAFTFEQQEKIAYIGVLLLNFKNLNEQGEKICICVKANMLVFIKENIDQTKIMIKDIIDKSADLQASISWLFISFMEKTIVGHIEQHEKIEDEIAYLEDAFLTERKNHGPGKILVLQKKLLVYKRYYEQLQHVLDDIQETKPSLINDKNTISFTQYTSRIERLLKNVLVLREYVTQVRESYEAETDISLNRIMRLFTVVTVIFLPLTLIAGWYGMNLQMPEFQWIWSYPLVIFISLTIVVISIIFFKKNKWF